MSLNFSELSRYYSILEDLQKKSNAGREILEDHGFVEQETRDKCEEMLCEDDSDVLPDRSKHVVLYNVVRKTFKELVHLCVLEKYGLAKS